MKFSDVLQIAGRESAFSSGLLMAGLRSPNGLRVQLSRWVAEGKIVRLRRGLYTVNPDYSGNHPDMFAVANAISAPSYVSCQTALAWHGVIPEAWGSVTSVTSNRTNTVTNPLGAFIYRHIKPGLLWGWDNSVSSAKIALPEKALLDLVYLEPEGDSISYIRQLRLSDSGISINRLQEFAERWGKKKILRAADTVTSVLGQEDL